MKLGFVSAILPDLSLREVAHFAGQAGFTCVELMCWPVSKAERRYAGVTHVDVTNFNRSHADDVSETLAAEGVELSGLGYYPNPLSPDRDEAQKCIKHLQKVIRAAPLLGCDQVNTFIGRERVDNVGILATPLEYHVPKLPGLGEVDWGRFFSVLGDTGYAGPVCIEVEDRAFEGTLELRQAALHQSATYLRNFVAG